MVFASAVLMALALVPDARGEVSDLVTGYVAAWNGSIDDLDKLLAGNFVDSTSLLPIDGAQFAMQLAGWRAMLPDLRVTVLERTSAPGREVLRLRYEGQPVRAGDLVPFTGGRVAIEQSEWLTIADGRIASRRATADEWTLPTELMFVPPPSQPFEPYDAATIARLGPGVLLESIAVAADGRLFISTGLDGSIVTLDQTGAVAPFAKVDVGPGGLMMCLAFDRHGALHATVNSRAGEVRGVWRFDRDGRGTRIAALPPGAVPNGLAVDDRDNLLVADTFGGVIWRVPAGGGTAQVWLRHPWLTPRPLVGRYPGANGLQRSRDAVFVTVSDRSLVLRIPVDATGAAGMPGIYASGVPGDDFAIAADGTLYITTHPFNSVVRLTPDGRRVAIAGPAQGVIGPTAAALADDGSLYVVSDGGLFRALPGVAPEATVVRLRTPSPQ